MIREIFRLNGRLNSHEQLQSIPGTSHLHIYSLNWHKKDNDKIIANQDGIAWLKESADPDTGMELTKVIRSNFFHIRPLDGVNV